MIETNRITLPNGLRIIHNYDSATAMVALNVLYNVGSRDENPDRTGMAHLFEHLMFGGSENISDFDAAIETAGGVNNAWTSNDYTNFYDIVPAHNVETAFWLESDRMKALAFSDKALEVQRQVVCEEFKQVCLNQPYGDLSHHLNALAYKVHPYRYPVIGKELSHIQGVTQEHVRDFFYSHYAPNNAVLAISGNISFDKARALSEKWFGDIPSRFIPKRSYKQEPRQTDCRHAIAEGRVPQTMIVQAYKMPGYFDRDYIVCDTITDLLASGRSSRFYRNLLMSSDLFTEVDASITGYEEPGLLMLTGKLRDNADVESASQALFNEASRLSDDVTDYELERTLNRFESNFTFGSINYVSRAAAIAMCEMRNEDINDTVPKYRTISTSDIRRVTKTIFNSDNCSTLVYRPAK